MCSPTLMTARARVCHMLFEHYNHERRDAFPGYKRLAEMAKCSPRTAKRAVKVMKIAGFMSVEHRFRLKDRWSAPYQHDRTNVYHFAVGAPEVASTHNGDAHDERRDAPIGNGAGDGTAPSTPRPNGLSAPARPTPPKPAPPGPSKPNGAPAPPRPTAPNATSFAPPTDDPYWDAFEAAFVLEHRAAYGKGSTPGGVRPGPLRDQASGALNEIVAECVAWARQPEHGLDVWALTVAEELARWLARTWIRESGRDDRRRLKGHPIGWMCGDFTRTLCDEAVAAWKRAKRPLLPKPTPSVRPDPTTASHAAAIALAEDTAIKDSLFKKPGDFNLALRVGRAEGAKIRAALGLAAPSLIAPAAAELHARLVDLAGPPSPE
jgi:hypothetical protein